MKIILVTLSIYNAANGLLMLVAPHFWYEIAPGASETGPYNPHFVPDIAFAFLASATGTALAGFLTGRNRAYALVSASVFLGGHATLHVIEWSHNRDLLVFETLTIVLPGLLPALLLLMVWRKD